MLSNKKRILNRYFLYEAEVVVTSLGVTNQRSSNRT